MNRTANRVVSAVLSTLWTLSLAPGSLAQAPSPEPAAKAQDPAANEVVKGIVERMRTGEAAARRIRMHLVTDGTLPGGLEVHTDGQLRVLRTEQGELQAVHSTVDYSFADGISGRIESVRTPTGVRILEQNPTTGESYLSIDAALLADIEWAGKVLQRSNLPGQSDLRESAPLGSAVVEDLGRRYAIAKLSDKDHRGQVGTWYGGDRRTGPGLEGEDPDQPLEDRVEFFVRSPDSALLEVVYLQLGKPVQRIRVAELVIGEPMQIETFKVEDRGQRSKDVREHPPTWEQIRHLLEAAERTAGEPPPSKRKAGDGK